MSYATVVVPLVKAVQELKVENDDLRREFDSQVLGDDLVRLQFQDRKIEHRGGLNR